MAIPIDENYLLFFMGSVFIPFIGFLVKLIIDIGVIKSKLEQVLNMTKEHDKELEGIRRNENRINLIEPRLDRLERAQNGRTK